MNVHKFLLIAMLCFGLAYPLLPLPNNAEGKKIGVMWIGSSGMAKRVNKGLEDFLKQKAPGLDLEFKKELADEAAAIPVYERFQKEKDAVVFLRSNGVKFLVKHPPQKPAFVGGCTNPATLGAVKDLNAPGGNISGVTYYLPAKRQMAVMKKIFPQLKSVALLVQKGHPSAGIDTAETKEACQTEGIQYHEYFCTGDEDILSAVTGAKEKKADVIIIGNQALIIDSASIIAANAGNIPIFSYAEKPIKKKSALCGLVPDDEKLGRILADSLLKVVREGEKIGEIPIRTDPKPRFVVNMQMLKKLGITIPEAVMKFAKKIE